MIDPVQSQLHTALLSKGSIFEITLGTFYTDYLFTDDVESETDICCVAIIPTIARFHSYFIASLTLIHWRCTCI